MPFSKTYLGVLFAILLAFALRVFMLDFFSLRGDESFTVLFVQKPLAQMWHETLTVEPNPPLMYFLLRAWIALTGAGEFATRFFSVAFGVLCVPLVYRLARLVFATVQPGTTKVVTTDSKSPLTPLLHADDALVRTIRVGAQHPSPKGGGEKEVIGLIAMFLVAINPYQIWHSQDVRNYTMWPALTLLALVFFWQWYNRRGSPSWLPGRGGDRRHRTAHQGAPLLWFAIAELAALYTHYYEAFLLLALNVFVLATVWRERGKIIPWIISQFALAILYLPYPLVLSNRVSSYGEGSGRQGVALWDVARETFTAFVLSDTLDAAWREWLWIPFALIALAGLVMLFTKSWQRGLFFALYLGVPTLAVFGLNTIRPLYLERYLNGIAPICYLLLAYGIVRVSAGVSSLTQFGTGGFMSERYGERSLLVSRFALLAFCALAALVALLTYWTNPAYAKAPDWRGLANVINANAQPGDIILQNFPETSLVYYDHSKLPLVVYPETYLADDATDRSLRALNREYERVWFIPAAPDYWDPYQFVELWLNRYADLEREWRVGDFRLRLYGTSSHALDAMNSSGARFGDTFQLSGYRTRRDGDALRVVLYWRVLNEPRENFEVRVQLLESGKGVAAEATGIPVWGEYPTTEWRKNELVVDQFDFPNSAGATQVLVSVCEVETKECLPIGEAMMPGAVTLPIEP